MKRKHHDVNQISETVTPIKTQSNLKKIECERLIFREAMRDFRRTNYLTHSFFPYPGRFIPQIPRYFIRTYMKKDGIVLEPFSGSGCTLVEASLVDMIHTVLKLIHSDDFLQKLKLHQLKQQN